MRYILPFLLVVIFCTSCNKSDYSSGDLIEINLSKGLSNNKNYPLSYFVDKAELLELESGSGYYTQEPILWHFGEKFILVFDKLQVQILLFSRNGEFINKIGNKGQGPGEYNSSVIGTMNNDETKIVVANSYNCNVIIYDLSGQLIIQKNIANSLPVGVIEDVNWNSENCIDFLTPRPAKKDVTYPRLSQFSNDLKFLRGICTRKTNTNAAQYDMTYYDLFHGAQSDYFWISDNDTVFQYNDQGECKPVFRLFLDEKSKSGRKRNMSMDEMVAKDFVYSINMMANHLVIWMSPHGMQTAVYYNLTTGKTFSIQQPARCGELMQGLETYVIENDIYGYEPVEFRYFNPDQNICPINIPFWLPFFEHRADRLKNLDVLQPAIRDQLYTYFENPGKVMGMVLLVHHMK